MTKVALAFGSFSVGAALGSLFLGIHISAVTQPSSGQARMSHLSATGARNVVAITADASPKVPGIMMTVDHLEAIRSGQVLDGLECIDCVFEDATLRYSGGAYRLINPTFKGRVTVEFSGPAYDAVFLEHVVTAIG